MEAEVMKKGSLLLPAFLVLVFAGILFPACGGSSTPSATVEKFVDALNDRDFEGIYDMSSSAVQEGTSREDFINTLKTVWAEGTTFEDFEIVSEEINGDVASVTYRAKMSTPGMENEPEASERSVGLVLEDDEWKLN
jgi:hypothetical protein